MIKIRNLYLLIKPASSSCNLACRYCFYHNVADNRDVSNYGFMSLDTLETLVREAFDEPATIITFSFQGGEPTLCGLNFYKRFIELVRKYNSRGKQALFTMQTNGLLIDDEWAAFLKENNFLTGISLDGYKELHDQNRVNHSQDGTYAKVMKAIAIMNKHKAEYNILTVIQHSTVRHTDKLYDFFRRNNLQYLQFITCIDDFNVEKGSLVYSLTPELYEDFLKKLFDRWYENFMNGCGISIRNFDNWLGILRGYPPENCAMSGICSCSFTVESDGSVYPCDFYVLDQWRLGNIHNDTFSNMRHSEKAMKFIRVSQVLPEKCVSCRYLRLCRNGCRRDRLSSTDGGITINYYCQAYEHFFDYSLERFIKMLKLINH